MTTRAMTAGEHAQTARDFLAAPDREFAAGDRLQGSEKLYGAATLAVSSIMMFAGVFRGSFGPAREDDHSQGIVEAGFLPVGIQAPEIIDDVTVRQRFLPLSDYGRAGGISILSAR